MLVERGLLWAALLVLAIGCSLVLRPFAPAILWAIILSICSWPLYTRLRRSLLRGPGAALCMIFGFALIAVLPLAAAVPGTAQDVIHAKDWVQSVLASGLPTAPDWLYQVPMIGRAAGDLWNGWAADISAMTAFFRPYLGEAAATGLNLLLGIANGVLITLLALFICFFFLLNGDTIYMRARAIARRIGQDSGERMLLAMGRTVRGTVYAILGTAAAQSILTAIGLTIAGVPRAPLLALIAGFLSVLPIGAPVVWIPAGLWLLISGATTRGIFLLVYGVVVISGSDHIMRPWLISRGSRLPFPVTVLGVLGGVVAFGLLGIFLGPTLLGAGYALVKEYAEGEAPDEPA